MSVPPPQTSTFAAASATTDGPKSMTEVIQEPLNQLQKLSHTLFLSLSPTQARPPPAPPIDEFLKVNDALSEALKLARVHQINNRRIEELKAEVLGLEAQLHGIWNELEDGKRELEVIIDEGEERIAAIKKAKEASLPYPELLAYAQSISAFSSAPPNMPDMSLPGQPPPPLFFPPFPNEEKMRKGRLNAEAPLGNLGETHPVGQAPTLSPEKQEAQRHHPHANPYRQEHRPQQTVFDLDLDLNPDL